MKLTRSRIVDPEYIMCLGGNRVFYQREQGLVILKSQTLI